MSVNAPQQPRAAAKARKTTADLVRDVVRLGVDASAAYQRPDLEERLRGARARVNRTETVICVAGEFKQGKSSLINALIGEQVSPVDDDLATSTLLALRHAEAPKITVRRKGEHGIISEEIERAQLLDYASERGNPDNRLRVELIEIALPNSFLEHGIVLVDTPGAGSLSAGYATATLAFLPMADGLIFVTDASAELSAPEVEYLLQARERCPTVLLAVTKTDLYLEWRRIVDLNRGHLECAGVEAQIVPVSSLLRTLALGRKDRAMNQESGMPGLLKAVKTEILEHVEDNAQRDGVRAVRSATELMLASFQTERDVLQQRVDSDQTLAQLEAARLQLNHLRSQGARWSTLLNDGFAILTSDVDYQFRSKMRALLRELEDELETIDPAQQWEELTAKLQADVSRATEESFLRIDDGVLRLRDEISTLLHDEVAELAKLHLPELSFDFGGLWPERRLEKSGPAGKVFKGLSAMRGSYMGLLMAGMLGSLLGIAVIGPVLIGAGLLFGGRQIVEERRRDVQRRRQQARQFIRQFIDDVQFEIGTKIRDATRDLQRELRDFFTERVTELGQTYGATIQNLQQSLQQDQGTRAARVTELQTRIDKLGELLRRVEAAEQRL
jgi:GTPase SAR1 family protein